MYKTLVGISTATALMVSTSVVAHEHEAAAQELADSKLKAIVADAMVISAIQAQNKRTAALDEAAIIVLDKK